LSCGICSNDSDPYVVVRFDLVECCFNSGCNVTIDGVASFWTVQRDDANAATLLKKNDV